MEYVVCSWWWFRYSRNGQLAIDVAGGGVGRLVVVLVVLVSGIVMVLQIRRTLKHLKNTKIFTTMPQPTMHPVTPKCPAPHQTMPRSTIPL